MRTKEEMKLNTYCGSRRCDFEGLCFCTDSGALTVICGDDLWIGALIINNAIGSKRKIWKQT